MALLILWEIRSYFKGGSKDMIADQSAMWFERFTGENQNTSIRLFCFPYAGGGASVYKKWLNYLPKYIEMYSLQLPGREKRLMEPCYKDLRPLVLDIAKNIFPLLDKSFIFFGHSMGALISFELTRYLYQKFNLSPEYLFVSGFRAPHLPSKEQIYDLPKKQFIQKLKEFNGTNENVLLNEDIMEFLDPLIRSDIEVCETYSYIDGPPFICPISAFGGLGDIKVNNDDLMKWKIHTISEFKLHMFPGDHFYLNLLQKSLIETIDKDLRKLL